MARFKIGGEIQNYGDVSNLIINLINNGNEFSSKLIVRLTNNYIQGSSIQLTESEINRMVHNILDVMQKHGYVVYSKGIYTIKSTNFTLEEYYKHSQAGLLI